MELLAVALEPYAALPQADLVSICVFVLTAAVAIICGMLEIVSRIHWNHRFQQKTSLGLGPVLRCQARLGLETHRYPPTTAPK